MEKCLETAKNLIDRQINNQVNNNIPNFSIDFTEYCFGWSNENISAYLDLVPFYDKTSALSVLASGDQLFSLITNGITQIDTFDINRLTEYYALGFKRAMILKYDYNTFKSIMSFISSSEISIEYINELIIGLFPYMETKHINFWRSLIDYNYLIQKRNQTNINLFRMLCLNFHFTNRDITNDYLKNEENYEKLRKGLRNANISFKCANAIDLANVYKGKFDFILLSNILDYFVKFYGRNWTYDKLLEYEKRLETLANPRGTIFLEYMFEYPIFTDDEIIDGASITISDLKNGERAILLPTTKANCGEGVILKRVR